MPFGDGVHSTFTFPDNSVSSITFPSRATGARHSDANLADSRAAFPPRVPMTFVASVGWSLAEWEDEENVQYFVWSIAKVFQSYGDKH